MAVAEVPTFPSGGGPSEVLSLLREQAGLYGRLESFAERQRKLVRGDDPGLLLSLLADRQKVSSELARIAGVLEPWRRDWSTYRERLSPGQRAEADGLVSEASDCLRRLIDGDERDAKVLSVRKAAVAQTLGAVHTTSRAIGAYREPAERSGRLDCVDEGV